MPVLIVIIAILAGLAFYSDSSNPGETLYPVDTTVEKVWETFTLDATEQSKVRAGFAGERMKEIDSLKSKNKLSEMNLGIIGLETNLRDAVDSARKAGRGKNEVAVDLVSDKIAEAREKINNFRSAGLGSAEEEAFLESVNDFLELERRRLQAEITPAREASSKLSVAAQDSAAASAEISTEAKDLEAKAKDELDRTKSLSLKKLSEILKEQEKLFIEQTKAMQKEELRLNNS